jgi:hypothetical protein
VRQVFPPKFAGDTRTLSFDFTSLLASGESVASAVCFVSVYSGTDASPSSMLNGAAVVSSPLVNQSFQGGVLGTIYEVKCTATTTGVSPAEILNISGFLAILQDLV